MTLEYLRFALSAICMAGGLCVILTGVIGVFRFKYVLNRLHAASLNDTLGFSLIILSLVVARGFDLASLKLLLLVALLWCTSPVSGHLIARLEVTVNEDLRAHMEVPPEWKP